MQIEVSATRVMDMLAEDVARLTVENARLKATNEVITERLREYVERDRASRTPQASQAVDDGHLPPHDTSS